MAQPVLQINLSQLTISDGTGQRPGPGTGRVTYVHLADQHLLDLLTNEFNGDQTRLQFWGITVDFIGSLPTGFGQWTHRTRGRGVAIHEVFGHPRIRFRSARAFMRHVDEILLANEGQVRAWIQGIDPNNVQNNTAILALAGLPPRTTVNCGC